MKTIKTMKTIRLLALLFISTMVFTACSDDHDHDHDHEEELITTVIYTLTSPTNMVTLQWEDLDGDTGNPPVLTVNGTFTPNTTYTGTIQLLDKTQNPAKDVTLEVEQEGAEHEFFYNSTLNGVTFTKTDVDANNNPIGIRTTVRTGNASSGTLTIVLRHEPTKPNNGTLANAGGSTDVDVTFNVSVQ